MDFNKIYTAEQITEMAKKLFKYERSKTRLDGWFIAKEIESKGEEKYKGYDAETKKALILKDVVAGIPLEISENNIFAGTQDDGFAKSYALINPSFRVETFSGYCDPTAVFNDIEPNEEFPKERIEKMREEFSKTPYVTELSKVYENAELDTKEVAYFIEQVTGHLIPDFRFAIANGVEAMMEKAAEPMKIALESVIILADRYAALAKELMATASDERKEQLKLMVQTLETAPKKGAKTLYEAIQVFLLLWQIMCLEQTPNPFAFSVGNADRIFEPYRNGLDRDTAAALLKHFLVFFNVGDRSWAISQNIIIGGRDKDGNDLTNETSYALLDAYYDMNMPQPILSVKMHKNTPDKLHEELGRFFFSPGILTPSLFNDDSLFAMLKANGIDEDDIVDTSIAGCQEPLIMGKDNGNTTNSWLNLPKILELTLTGGTSLITGEKLADLKPADLKNLREEFYKNVEFYAKRMTDNANGASRALSNLKVPFLSCFMGGLESGIDTRDTEKQGTKYNGSGCLIHGVSVIADSLVAVDKLLKEKPEEADRLVDALKANFVGFEDLRAFLMSAPKFGNNIDEVDKEAVEVVNKVTDIVTSKKNYLGNPFRADYASPSTHLTYGYWVGATPDGRQSREMLGYGVDPLFGEATNGMGFRMLSALKLPYGRMGGGYASHLGIDPKYFRSESFEGKGMEFKEKIVNPLFFSSPEDKIAPFYLYVNVTTPETLRKVQANPKKYAPSGVYIMRIHGTFVNFLDLSPAIQNDIIKRLDLKSTTLEC